MNYYFIYSAGGGAGDWNGIKRVWNDSMSPILKERVLLKFGDVFFNHASSASPIKKGMWKKITDVRKWLYDNVNDEYVLKNTNILLDSGTSKLINHISTQNNELNPEEIIYKFRSIIEKNNVLEKLVEIIIKSNINEAVTIDAPNPFKIRTKSENTVTNIFRESHDYIHVELNAEYCNKMYEMLGGQEKMLTTFNGLWDKASLKLFLKALKYKPNKVAIGGLTRANDEDIQNKLSEISQSINLKELDRVHFLGCGGVAKTISIKKSGFLSEKYSVDNSTPYNRAIDGNTTGASQSGYFDYTSKELYRINPDTKTEILELHSKVINKHFSNADMENIIDGIIKHQSGNSGHDTYNNRARLIIHNHDVFRQNAL